MTDKWDAILAKGKKEGYENLQGEDKFAFDRLTREHSSRGQSARDVRDGKK